MSEIFSKSFGEFIIRNRIVVLILILLATVFFAWNIRNVTVDSPLIDLFPSDHPYVETYVKYQDIFGGANTILVSLEVEEGDIFNEKTLGKIRTLTKEFELLPGINNYNILSIAQRKVKNVTVEVEGQEAIPRFKAVPMMWPDIPRTEEEIQDVKRLICSTSRIYGSLVSLDLKAALIVAGFIEGKFEPEETSNRIQALVEEQEDENTSIQVIGRPIMLGWILHKYPQLKLLFTLTMLSIITVLIFYFRDIRGVLIPLLTAGISAIWGIGFLGLFRYNFDPLVIVVPFIISERALSHSVQLIERYYEEYKSAGDREKAAVATFSGLFQPGILSIITDAAGVFIVWLTPIPLMQKLAIMGSFWVLSIVVSDLIFNPVFLSFFPPPLKGKKHGEGFSRLAAAFAGLSRGGTKWAVLSVTAVIFVIGFIFVRTLVIGDVHPGTPMLWPDSPYNQDTERIGKRFGNTEIFNVIVEGKSRNAIKSPPVLQTMEFFQKDLESLPEVSHSSSIVDLLPGIISAMHGGDPKWDLIPLDPGEAGFFLEMIYSSAEPGDLVRFVTQDSKNANIALYLKDHKGETLRKVVDRCKEFIENNPLEDATFRLAGGYGGLLAAVNEVVTKSHARVTIMAFLIIFLCCGIAYRSVLAGFLFLIPLAVSNYLTFALMGARKIGLDVNALPVIALGVGLGVDYGLYVVGRIKEEYQKCGDLDEGVLDLELFGFAKGINPKSVAPRQGLIELVSGGTLFLDEIDLLSPHLQSKVLRVLMEGEVRRIGDSIARKVDLRIIASTNRDLSSMVSKGTFRKDLFLVLNRHQLTMPPLRQRREDVIPLANTFMQTYMKRYGKMEMCGICKISDKRVLVVHHVDSNRKNNTFKNLMWLCRNCHCLVHFDK